MLKIVLIPLAILYGIAVWVRNLLFDTGMLKSREFDIPIVCIGNLTVGGTGKTPMAEFIIAALSERYSVALLSRGYKRRTKGFRLVDTATPYRDSGDEPKQAKLKFPHIVVAVCEDRAEGIDRIRRIHPEVNLIVLDDAFQHRRVEPWINIVLMDYTRPVFRDHLLPWGRLRDIPRSLHRANAVVVTKCPADITPLEERLIIKQLNLYPYQSLFFTQMIQDEAYPLFEPALHPVLPRRSNVIAMAGIGNPGVFVESLRRRFNVAGELIFRDHHPYRMRDLRRMERSLGDAPDNTFIVTTEKDAVKLTNARRIPKQIRDRLYFVPLSISFAGNGEEEFLQKIYQYVGSNQKDRLQYK